MKQEKEIKREEERRATSRSTHPSSLFYFPPLLSRLALASCGERGLTGRPDGHV